MLEIKNLIKLVGINVILTNVIWSGITPLYCMNPINICTLTFFGFKYNFNLNNYIPYLQCIISLKILYDIQTA